MLKLAVFLVIFSEGVNSYPQIVTDAEVEDPAALFESWCSFIRFWLPGLYLMLQLLFQLLLVYSWSWCHLIEGVDDSILIFAIPNASVVMPASGLVSSRYRWCSCDTYFDSDCSSFIWYSSPIPPTPFFNSIRIAHAIPK